MAELTIPRLNNRPLDGQLAPIGRSEASSNRLDIFANVVSIVLSPPLMAAGALALAATTIRGDEAWLWASMDLALTVLTPIGFLLWLFRRGLVSDLDVQRREERARPLTFTLATMFLAIVTLKIVSAPGLLLAVSATHFLQTGLVLAISLRWKISVHGAAAAVCVALLWCAVGHVAALALLLLPLLGWSRTHLRRHTPAQVIAGMALGGLVTSGMLLVIPGI